MEAKQTLCGTCDQKPILKFNGCEPTKLRNSSHVVGVFEVLQSLRKEGVLCDIRIETDDGTIILGHKVVLVSVCPYFRSMFTRFEESKKELIHIKELDSTTFQSLIDYIYNGEIVITVENIHTLLPAANFLQLDFVIGGCVEFLQKQIIPSNCLGIKAFADMHNCMELLAYSEAYIKKHFVEVIKYDEFLSLSSEEVIKLISGNDLTVSLEEKVKITYLKCYIFMYLSQYSLSLFHKTFGVRKDNRMVHKKLF
ncbi:unnamed protein product [Macrosiphum euphorbiae]|uniref:BTB domain-containing protein n=1 Tax=Macrosiphum euphorbiae TaxID=13131 RepID=A0AAV0VKE8_9HEMI|nr:unnamed protein product [Macrosiphum euphorbiae]